MYQSSIFTFLESENNTYTVLFNFISPTSSICAKGQTLNSVLTWMIPAEVPAGTSVSVMRFIDLRNMNYLESNKITRIIAVQSKY